VGQGNQGFQHPHELKAATCSAVTYRGALVFACARSFMGEGAGAHDAKKRAGISLEVNLL